MEKTKIIDLEKAHEVMNEYNGYERRLLNDFIENLIFIGVIK